MQYRCHTSQQATAAHGHNDGFGVRNLFQDFQSHRPLPRDHLQIIKRMDVGELAFGCQSPRFAARFIKSVAVQNDRGTELPTARHFHQWSKTRHHDRDGNAQQPSVPCQPERMVSRRRGDDARTRLRRRQLRQRVARAAFLETARALEIFLFAKNMRAGQFAQRGGFRAGRVRHRAQQTCMGGDDFRQRNHAVQGMIHKVIQ